MNVTNIKRGRQKRHPRWRQRFRLPHTKMMRYKQNQYNCKSKQLTRKESCSTQANWETQSSSDTLSSHTTIQPKRHFLLPSNVSSHSHLGKEIVGDSCHWDDPYWSSHDIRMHPNRIVYTPSTTTLCKATQTSQNFKQTLLSLTTNTWGQPTHKPCTIQRNTIGTQTFSKGISLMDSSQQTIATLNCLFHHTSHSTSDRYQQTEILMQTQSIQCRCKVFHIGVQTQGSQQVNSSTQIWSDDLYEERTQSSPLCCKNCNGSEENLPKSPKKPAQEDKEAVIYLLSEIGELVLNQNHMLSNNTRLLDQLSEISLITKRMEIGRLWS